MKEVCESAVGSYGNKNLSPEDVAFMNLSREALIFNIEDFKSRMYGFTAGHRGNDATVILLLPSISFLRSPTATCMLELLGLGDSRYGYDVLSKLDRIYNKKGLRYDLTESFNTKEQLQMNIRRVLKVLDISLEEFQNLYCYEVSYGAVASCTYGIKDKSLELNKSKKPRPISDNIYRECIIGLKKLFEDYNISDILPVNNTWGGEEIWQK